MLLSASLWLKPMSLLMEVSDNLPSSFPASAFVSFWIVSGTLCNEGQITAALWLALL